MFLLSKRSHDNGETVELKTEEEEENIKGNIHSGIQNSIWFKCISCTMIGMC